MTYAEITDEARDFHPAFTDAVIPHKAATRALYRIELRLARAIAERDEDFLSDWVEFTPEEVIAAYESGEGLPLGSYASVVEATKDTLDSSLEVPMVIPTQRGDFSYRWPTAYTSGGRFFISPHSSWKWEPDATLRVRVVKLPEKPETNAAEVTLPEVAHDVLVEELALWMATRLNVLRELPGLRDSVEASRATLIDTVAALGSTSNWWVRRVV
jgi:hypothetical protein